MKKFTYHDDGTVPKKEYFNKGRAFWVFGSNLSGWHGAGAAKVARELFGAEIGVGLGFTGQTYAIPTKDYKVESLTLEQIKPFIEQFVYVTNSQQDCYFFITRVGCGLAGFDDKQIAPLFKGCNANNCSLPAPWRDYLET